MAKKIDILFKTMDGQVFDCMEDAKIHASSVTFESWYAADPLPGITADIFKKWAKKHKDSIAEM